MSLTRRAFLQSAAALGSAAALPRAALAAPGGLELRASQFRQKIRASGPATALWGFNGTCPGPLLRFKPGDTLDARLLNELPQATTVHWHGLRVPNAMDGVPYVTQAAVMRGSSFHYRFPIVDSGTYWYHPHQSSFEQVSRGLYGAFIVEEERPLEVDREVVWILGDFKLGADGQHVEDFGKVLDFGAGGRIGNTLAIDGTVAGAERRLELRPNERVRLRLINAASARIFNLAFAGHEPWVVSLDGQGVQPFRLEGVLQLGPGQRTDLVIDGIAAPAEAYAISDRRDEGARIATLAYAGRPARAKALGAPAAIARNRHVEPNLGKATEHFLVFEGGVLGQPSIGLVDGKALDTRQIMERHGLTWTMNYTAQHEHAQMHEPLFRFRRNEHATLKMINNTEFEHPMHLHGHFFKVLALNDRKLANPVWRDTVNIGPRGSCDIAFVAENVGEWMFHCHILDHAAGGMMGTIAIEG